MTNSAKAREFVFQEPTELQEWYDIGADIRVNIRMQFSKLSRAYNDLQTENQSLRARVGELEVQYQHENERHNECRKSWNEQADEIQRLREALRDAFGHSNCYCQGCQAMAKDCWSPKKDLILFGDPQKALQCEQGKGEG